MTNPTLTHAELVASGLTADEIAHLRRQGRLHRLRRGVYTVDSHADEIAEHLALIEANRKTIGPRNVLSHTSAGVVHDLPVRRAALERATFTRLTPGHGDKQAHVLMRNTAITASEIATIDGWPVTTLARTVADIARLEPQAWGVAAADAALAKGLDSAAISEVLALHPRIRGVRRARSIVAFASPLAESPLESISRYNMSVAGLPEPELQVEMFDDDGEFVARPDFLWRELGVVGESHGVAKYTELRKPGQSIDDVLEAQYARAQRLRAMGFEVVDWGWDVGTSPHHLRDYLGAAFAKAGGRRWRGRGVARTA